jgi:hypothetical protein
MSEQRNITVERDNPIWQEYDREVKIELWHNPNQVTSLRLSPEEAGTLLVELRAYLEATK